MDRRSEEITIPNNNKNIEDEEGIQTISRSLEKKKMRRLLRSVSNFRQTNTEEQTHSDYHNNNNIINNDLKKKKSISMTLQKGGSKLSESTPTLPQEKAKLENSSSFAATSIQPSLFLGGKFSAIDQKWIVHNKIKIIITIGGQDDFHEDCETLYRELSIRHIVLEAPTERGCNILKHFNFCFSIMDSALLQKEGVLLHCNNGITKSPSFIVGYIMSRRNLSFPAAYQLVVQKRPEIKIDSPYETQLSIFDTFRDLKNFTLYIESKNSNLL